MTNTAPEMLVQLLTQRLRVISDRQAATEPFGDAARPLQVARTAISRLERAGLVETFTAMVHPELTLEAPILDWRPGDPLPNFDRIAWQLNSRWSKPPVRTKIVYATRKAKRLRGGYCGGRKPRAKEITHDIHVARVFFGLRQKQPDLANHWISEDQLRAEGREGDIPDAVIRPLEGAEIIVEFGGSYGARKLRSIHQNYAQHGRYQIW